MMEPLPTFCLIILVAFGRQTEASRQLSIVLEHFGNCEHVNKKDLNSFFHDVETVRLPSGETVTNGMLNVTRDVPRGPLVSVFKKCSERWSKNCEHFIRVLFPDSCPIFKAKGQFWTPIVDNFTPKLTCPVLKMGSYKLVNGTLSPEYFYNAAKNIPNYSDYFWKQELSLTKHNKILIEFKDRLPVKGLFLDDVDCGWDDGVGLARIKRGDTFLPDRRKRCMSSGGRSSDEEFKYRTSTHRSFKEAERTRPYKEGFVKSDRHYNNRYRHEVRHGKGPEQEQVEEQVRVKGTQVCLQLWQLVSSYALNCLSHQRGCQIRGQSTPTKYSVAFSHNSLFYGNYNPPGYQGFCNNYQQFPAYEANSNNYYQSVNQNFPPNAPPSQNYNMGAQGTNWDGSMIYPDTSVPPPPSVIQQQPASLPAANNTTTTTGGAAGSDASVSNVQRVNDQKAQEAKKEAVEQEMMQQKRTLEKQREDYIYKSNSLKRELNRLKDQKRELLQEDSKDNERILRENAKLQNEIQQKLKAINNVIEMLSGIIGDSGAGIGKEFSKSENSETKTKLSVEPPLLKTRPEKYNNTANRGKSSSPEITEVTEKQSMNIVHYDHELHWCSECNVFPPTAIDYLNHLHSEEHNKKLAGQNNEDLPWHINQPNEKSPPFIKNAPHKRIPILGLQFLYPAIAWYCKLCKVWMGDLHCAQIHLKGSDHRNSYNEFSAQNPHWEVDWLANRAKAFRRISGQSANVTELKTLPTFEKPYSPSPSDSQGSGGTVNVTSLSDQLIAMLEANNNKTSKRDAVIKSKTSSSSSSDTSSSSDSSDEKSSKKSRKKKKKKSKKKRREEDKYSEMKKSTMIEAERSKKEADFHSEFDVKITQSKKIGNSKLDEDRIIREWMVPPDTNDKEMTSNLKGRLKQKHDSEQQKKREERYKDDKRDKYNEKRYRDYYRDSRDYREYKESRDKRRDERERRSPDSKSRYYDRAELKEEKLKAEKPQGKIWAPGKDDDDDIETNFEKRTSESAAKKKDTRKQPTSSNVSKTKLPFIGRMPILKKKPDQKGEDQLKDEKKEDKAQLDEDDGEKKPSFIWPDLPNIPEPPQNSEETQEPLTATGEVEQPLPKSTLIISKRPRLLEPEHIRSGERGKVSEDIVGEQDMDIEEEVVAPKDELHKDFKDALELLFPGEATEKGGENSKETKPAGDDAKQQEAAGTAPTGQQMIHPAWAGHGMVPSYYTPDGMYRPDQARPWGYTGTGYPADQQQYMQPPGYMPYTNSYMMPPDPAYMQPPQYNATTTTSYNSTESTMSMMTPTKLPDVPLPPGIEESEDPPDDGGAGNNPPTKKRKNPPSQRMRRHLQKKKVQAEALDSSMRDDADDAEASAEESGGGKDYQVEMSELAMLGIDEEDITAQSFH
ncbi:hypothetical protein AAG570_008798 [Ranatra chinensis]|uniref:U1-type domain-containing protein n=1 Tax=Ranatra chinensis TaxID=642074 RepID=A0ABD0YRZ9_9HEMI